jgi:lysozyme
MTPANFGPACLAIGLPAIRGYEAFRSRPYQDSGGKWTIGFGSTCLSDGSPVTHATPAVNTLQADAIMAAAVGRIVPRLERLVTRALPARPSAAIVSLTYNIGTGALATSTLLRKLNVGDMAGVAAEFLDWDHVRDPRTGLLVISEGLVARRAQERRMFLGADLSPTALATARHPRPAGPSPQPGADALMAGELREPIS